MNINNYSGVLGTWSGSYPLYGAYLLLCDLSHKFCKSYLLKNYLPMATPMVQIIVISDDKYPNTT